MSDWYISPFMDDWSWQPRHYAAANDRSLDELFIGVVVEVRHCGRQLRRPDLSPAQHRELLDDLRYWMHRAAELLLQYDD